MKHSQPFSSHIKNVLVMTLKKVPSPFLPHFPYISSGNDENSEVLNYYRVTQNSSQMKRSRGVRNPRSRAKKLLGTEIS